MKGTEITIAEAACATDRSAWAHRPLAGLFGAYRADAALGRYTDAALRQDRAKIVFEAYPTPIALDDVTHLAWAVGLATLRPDAIAGVGSTHLRHHRFATADARGELIVGGVDLAEAGRLKEWAPISFGYMRDAYETQTTSPIEMARRPKFSDTIMSALNQANAVRDHTGSTMSVGRSIHANDHVPRPDRAHAARASCVSVVGRYVAIKVRTRWIVLRRVSRPALTWDTNMVSFTASRPNRLSRI